MHKTLKDLGFTETHILKIARIEKHIESVESSLLKHQNLIQELITAKFSPTNITSMLGHSGTNCGKLLEDLNNNKYLISDLMMDLDLSPSNITAIISYSSPATIDILNYLHADRTNIKALMHTLNFKGKNLSGIISGALRNTKQCIKSLIKHQKLLLELEGIGFKPDNLSSILSKSRKNLDIVLTHLRKEKNKLIYLTANNIFTPANISSIIGGASINIGEVINTLDIHKSRFLEFKNELGFKSNNISNILQSIESHHIVIEQFCASKDLFRKLQHEIGFSAKNLSNILSKARINLLPALAILLKHSLDLKQLIDQEILPAESISNILGQSITKIEDNLVELFNTRDQFLELKRLGFKASNISSIFGRISTGKKQQIQYLIDNYQLISEYNRYIGFSISNFSNMLSNGGNKIDTIIPDLIKLKEPLLVFMKETGLGPSNISNILMGSRTSIIESLNELILNKTQIINIKNTSGLESDSISSILNCSGKQVNLRISILLRAASYIKKLIDNGITSSSISCTLQKSRLKLISDLKKHYPENVFLHQYSTKY